MSSYLAVAETASRQQICASGGQAAVSPPHTGYAVTWNLPSYAVVSLFCMA